MTLGEAIRVLRKDRGMTQRALAGADLSDSYISMVEHDRVRPSLATLSMLADRLGTTAAALLRERTRGDLAGIRTRLSHGEALLRRHQFTSALEQYEAALTAASAGGDERLQAEAHLGLGQVLLGLRQFDLAIAHLEEAARTGARLQDAGLRGRAANARGLLALRQRDLPGARDALREALSLVREHRPRDQALEARILTNLGRVYTGLGLPLQALMCYEEARPELEALSDPTSLALLHFNAGVTYIEQQGFDQAAHHLSRAADLFEVQENLQLLGTVKRSLGILLLDRGQALESETLLRQSLSIADRLADDAGRAQALTELARAALRQDRLDEAGELARQAEGLATRVEDPAEAGRARLVLAAVALQRGRADEALAGFREAADIFETLQMPKERSEALGELGFVYLQQGEEGEAARAFAQALSLQKVRSTARP